MDSLRDSLRQALNMNSGNFRKTLSEFTQVLKIHNKNK